MTRNLIRRTHFRRPFTPAFAPMFDRELLDGFFLPVLGRFGQNEESAPVDWSPAADFAYSDDAYTLTLDLPGLSKEDVEVAVNDNTLIVSGERHIDRDGVQMNRIERHHGRFSRHLNLPADANAAEATAEFSNGVLQIVIPKAREAKPRTITIS